MRLGTLLSINAVLLFVFGLGFVVIPAPLMSLYGVTLSPIGITLAQLLGAAFLGFGIVRWLARNSTDSLFARSVVFAAFMEDSIGFVVLLQSQLAGLTNASGWSNVILYGFFAIAFGYFHFRN